MEIYALFQLKTNTVFWPKEKKQLLKSPLRFKLTPTQFLQPPQNNRPLSCPTTTTRSLLTSSKDVEKKLSINNRWSKSYPNIFFSVFQRRRKKFQIGGESVIVNLGCVSWKKIWCYFLRFCYFFFWRDSWSDKKLNRQHRTAVFRKKKTTNLTFYLNSWKQQYLTPKQSSRIRLSQRAGEWRRPHGVNGDNIILIFIFAFKEDNSASFFYEFLLPVILHFTYFIITHFIYYSSSFITVFSLNLKSFQTSLSNLQLQPLL